MQGVRVRMLAMVLMIGCALVMVHSATAQDVDSSGAINTKGLGGPDVFATNNASFDKKFLKKAIESSQDDVAMAKLAAEKSSDSEVKEFAQQEIDDHGKMLQELKQAAQEAKVSVADDPTKGAAKTIDKMKSLEGNAFDAAFLQEMVKSHKDEEKGYRGEARTTTDAQLRSLVNRDADVLEKHLQQVEQLCGNAQEVEP